MFLIRAILVIFSFLCFLPAIAAGDTLQEVRKRGFLNCGVSLGLPGFSSQSGNGDWQGLDVDFCKAVSLAVLGDAKAVRFIPLSAKNRFSALSSKRIDILSRNTTWTMGRQANKDIDFVGVIYLDSQGFMTKRNSGLTDIRLLHNQNICILGHTTTYDNAFDYFGSTQINVKLLEFETHKAALKAYLADECVAYTADVSALAAQRAQAPNPEDHVFLQKAISKEPLSPAVRSDDLKWRKIVQSTLFLLINAEEAGWTSARVRSSKELRPMQVPTNISKNLNLEVGWAEKVIAGIGNYGEIFDRNLGETSSLKLDRSVNKLWTMGGLLYAPALR